MQLSTTHSKKVFYLISFLVIFLTLRIACYYTFFPDNIVLTRIVKVGGRFLLTGVAAWMLLRMMSRWRNLEFKYLMILPILLYCCYLFLGLLSIMWSTNPSFSMLQLGMTLETFVFSLIFYRVLLYCDGKFSRKIPLVVTLLSRAVLIHSIWFIIGAFVDPDFYYRTTHGGTVARLGGLIINPNELGLLALMGIGASYVEILSGKNLKFQSFSVVICIIALLMTQSRSSLLGLLILTGIFVLLHRNVYLKIGSVVIAVFVLPILFNTIILKAGDFNEVASFTGRKEFWGDLINEAFPERPIWGRGFMSIAENQWFNKYQSTHSYTTSMSHNTYVEVLTNLGLVGAFICLLQILATITAIVMNQNRELRIMALFMLLPLLLNSITEFGIFGHNNYAIMFYHFVFLFFTLSVSRENTPTFSLTKAI